ncbi:RRT13 (YER066W) [Zygosaccharomyces parabailii]|nr:RRT13 (YER066W) [Zygosaccharomyces parabailii]CDH12020.1 uncharacterized protein ZBAI_03806 [Zygosaccharomyces bailii ISA1307]
MQFADDDVITGADDKIIRIYDAEKKQFLLELKGHDGGVWDIDRGCCIHAFRGHTSTVRCLDIVEHNGTKYIVSGSRNYTLRVWRFPREQQAPDKVYPIVHNAEEENPYYAGVLRGHKDSVRVISGHGKIVVSGAYDGKVIVWDIAQMLCLYILSGHTDRIYSTIYDYKHNRCISGSMDTNVGVWDLNNIQKSDTCGEAPNLQAPCTKVCGSLLVLRGHTSLVGLLKTF